MLVDFITLRLWSLLFPPPMMSAEFYAILPFFSGRFQTLSNCYIFIMQSLLPQFANFKFVSLSSTTFCIARHEFKSLATWPWGAEHRKKERYLPSPRAMRSEKPPSCSHQLWCFFIPNLYFFLFHFQLNLRMFRISTAPRPPGTAPASGHTNNFYLFFSLLWWIFFEKPA